MRLRQAPEENISGLFAALKPVIDRAPRRLPRNPVVLVLGDNRTALPAQPQFPPQILAETQKNPAFHAKFPGLDAHLRN